MAGNSRPHPFPAISEARAVSIKVIHRGELIAVRSALGLAEADATEPYVVRSFGVGDACICSVQLLPLQRADIWRNGRHVGAKSRPAGGYQVFDLRQSWRAVIEPPFESVNLRISLAVLAAAARDAGVGDFELSLPATGDDRCDPILHHLAQALLPAFHRPAELTALFAEHVVMAAGAHLVLAQRRAGTESLHPRRGLALWQQRRAIDMLTEAVNGEITVAELAAACRVSPGHFSRSFRRSFGLPPHRWLLRERVRRAAELMRGQPTDLSEIAVSCGFVDQSHLSRVFRVVMNTTPAAWRRTQG